MSPPLWSVLAIVAVTGGGAALLFTHDPPQEASEAHSGPGDPDFDPLDLQPADCDGPLNQTLQVACDAAGLLP